MYNQGLVPESCSPALTPVEDVTMHAELAEIRAGIKRAVENMPRHEDFIAKNCRAPALAS
jgi:tryptophan 7-halogenase